MTPDSKPIDTSPENIRRVLVDLATLKSDFRISDSDRAFVQRAVNMLRALAQESEDRAEAYRAANEAWNRSQR